MPIGPVMHFNDNTTKLASTWHLMAVAAALALTACGPASVLQPVGTEESVRSPDAGTALVADAGAATTGSTSIPVGTGAPGVSPVPTSGGSTSGSTSSGSGVDAGPVTSSGSTSGSTGTGSTGGTTGSTTGTTTGTTSPAGNPSFGSWAWGAPDVNAVVHAGFKWFESGYPGTLSASDNAFLTSNGTVPFAYINMSEVPADTYLQGQIGSFWSSIALCTNSSWNTTVVDVRDPRWQDWLVRRANDAYALGNRGIKWDVAGVETLCNNWSGSATEPQQAVDAMASVLATLKAQHPDMKFIVNQGFALAEQHPELVDGFELENMINYADANSGDTWAAEMIARVGSIHTNSHIPILDLEYMDLFGCTDTSCAYANQLYSQIVGLDWVPYITVVHMDVQGRGLGITPPW